MISSDDVFLSKLKSLIDAHLDDPAFSVDAICITLGISRAHLHRVVKEGFNLSVTLYIRKIRLEKANDLLANTTLRISEVADRVGINNPQNFSKYFTEAFGINPTEFRRLRQTLVNENKSDLSKVEEIPKPPKKQDSPRPLLQRTNRWVLYGLLLVGLVFSLNSYIRTYIQPATRPADEITTSLAVLPLINMGPPDTSPICEGLMDDIHTGFLLIRHLRVTARASSDQYRGYQKSIRQIGEDLHVANVLRGKMLKIGDHIQAQIELIQAKEDRLIWAKTYNVAYRDVFQLTEQITKDIARELELENSPTATEKLALARTKNMTAYNHFLQGRQLVITRVKPDVLESITRFDQALALDSTFAEAYALKALAYYLLPGTVEAETHKNKQLSEQLALTAIRIDPTNSTAYGVLGTLYLDTYQWQAASNAFRIGIQNNPNDAQINYWYSLLLRAIGRVDEAVQYSTKAVALDPLHPIFMAGHITNCSYARRLNLARTGIESGQVLFGQSYSYQSAVARFWLSQHAYDRAMATLQKAITLNPDDKSNVSCLMYCEAKLGKRQKGMAFLHKLIGTAPHTDYDRSVIYAGIGQADSCLHYLKKAADGGYIYRDMKVVAYFIPYQDHPIFKAILSQYHYPIIDKVN